MESNPSINSGQRTTAKDFFLHLGSIAGLYAVAISLVNLLFTLISKAYPEVASGNYFYGMSYNISLPVATLIIVFPIFILLSWLNEKSYAVDPMKKQIGVRRWLTYVTLFVAGLILVGDLVMVLYKFLNGQDFTTAFLLKALTVLTVTGFIFGYYIQDIRERIGGGKKKIWAIVSALVIIASIILGFSVIGSPQSQRLQRLDDQKVSDLQNIQWQIISYWQKKGVLPESLNNMKDPISGIMIPTDPQSGLDYKYEVVAAKSFKLCAEFNTSSNQSPTIRMMAPYTDAKGSMSMDYWTHGMGQVCFDRNIDPTLYPVYK